ncbi:c-type cytochrome [Bradyrhizobium sp.]|uniref:c-type cytochrome n=1 Tax=Bradyrhizobium sp. TaxID=376 RepID=UPI003C26FE13
MKQFGTRSGRLVAAALAGAALAVVGIAAAPAQDAAVGDVANGKRLYLADGCFECHGRAGQGGAMNYQTPALAQLELPVESFVAFLREAPNDMPAYSANVLSDKDAADIHAFLRSLPGRKPVKDFPLLNQ